MRRSHDATTPMTLRSKCHGECQAGAVAGKGGVHHHHHHHSRHTSPVGKRRKIQEVRSSRPKVSKSKTSVTKQLASSNILEVLTPPSPPATPSIPSVQDRYESELNASNIKYYLYKKQMVISSELSTKTSNLKAAYLARATLDNSVIDASPELQSGSIIWSPTAVVEANSDRNNTSTPSTSRTSRNSYNSNISGSYISSHASNKNISIRSTSRPQYSDYSSADDLDFDELPKTDYTYARTFGYDSRQSQSKEVPSPNMSRRGLRRSGFSSNTTDSSINTEWIQSLSKNCGEYSTSKTNESLTRSSMKINQGRNLNGSLSRNHVNMSTSNVSYGLDYDSDSDEMMVKSNGGYTGLVTSSAYNVVYNIVDTILPVVSIWNKFWSASYSALCNILLLDTWIVRQRMWNKWLWLLLLLLPFLLLFGLSDSQDSVTFLPSLSLPSAWAASTSSFFAFFASRLTGTNSDLPIVKDTGSGWGEINFNMQESILHLHEAQKQQLSRSELEEIVRSVVQHEMLGFKAKFDSKWDEDAAKQTTTLLEHKSQMSNVQSQLQMLLTQNQNLDEKLRMAKIDIISDHKANGEENLSRFRRLELELETLQRSVLNLETAQLALMANMRNCCKNATSNPVLLEDQVAAILMKIMSNTPDLSNQGHSKVLGFADWMKSNFIHRDDLDARFTTISAKLSADHAKDSTTIAALAARLIAVEASLKQQLAEFSANLSLFNSQNGDTNYVSHVTEEDVRKIVHGALALYSADKTGQADFALESAGGSVISTRCSETFILNSAQMSLFGIPLWSHYQSPRIVIQSGVVPGECWAFKGSEGYLVIQLSGKVQPTAFVVEHIPRALAPSGNINSAPKDFSVYGLKSEKDTEELLIGRYTYDIEGEPLQYFAVANPEIDAFPMVELRIHSNHGNFEFTCLYRFRVHGRWIGYE